MWPDTRAVIIALTNPSRVATRSFIAGTSCGFTVVTRTSGAAGETLLFLREQAKGNETRIRTAVTTVSRFILWLWLIANVSVERRKKPDNREIWMRYGPPNSDHHWSNFEVFFFPFHGVTPAIANRSLALPLTA